MHFRNLFVGLSLLCSVGLIGQGQAAERAATTTLQITVRVREVVRPPQRHEVEHSDITFSLERQSKLVKTFDEKKVKIPPYVQRSMKEQEALLRTVTYTVE